MAEVNAWRGAPMWRPIEYTEGIERIMSVALWCDKGQHAFSEKDEDRQHFTQTKKVDVLTGNSYGTPTYQQRQEVTEELDICGPCWKKGNDFEPNKAPEIKNGSPTLDELEREDDDYRRGYDAAMTKLERNSTYGRE